jgi:hypothetical protein
VEITTLVWLARLDQEQTTASGIEGNGIRFRILRKHSINATSQLEWIDTDAFQGNTANLALPQQQGPQGQCDQRRAIDDRQPTVACTSGNLLQDTLG